MVVHIGRWVWTTKSGCPWLTRVWTTIQHSINFREVLYKLYPIKPRFVILERGEDSSKSTLFSPLTPHISYDDSGSEKVDPFLTLYKRIKSHLTKVSSTIHSFQSLCSREKTDLTVRGSFVGLHWSPLTIFSFFFGHWAIIVVRSLSAYWFSSITHTHTHIYIIYIYILVANMYNTLDS